MTDLLMKDGTPAHEGSEPLLSVSGLQVEFPIRSRILRRKAGVIHAVSGLDLEIASGETLGLIGETGCGKSTTGRAILQLIKPTAGSVKLEGTELTTLSRRELTTRRRDMQIVLQDPFASLDPRTTVRSIISEPLQVHGTPRDRRRWRVEELLELVGMDATMANRYPHEFSGGQRQRISIARALALSPKLLVLDEPLSALDVSIQAQIVNLLRRLQRETGISFLMISHDLAVVRQMCDRVAVMYLGRIVETGSVEEVYGHPSHPYTQALLSAAPEPDPSRRGQRTRIMLQGEVPKPDTPPPGCRFHTRCWRAQDICRTEQPALIERNGALHPSACHFATAPDETPAVV
ncbi:MAG: peptide transporter ATP-binding protein [Streptosporangiaceae bacterium]|nr:peptide transporter ATP-binding protein [Streptosporangiaceae bacterium]